MSQTNPIAAMYLELDQPSDVLGELHFARDAGVGYTDGDGRVHVVCVQRAGRRYTVVDHVDGAGTVIDTLDAYDDRAAALALCVDWAIQARLYATGRRESNPTPRQARAQRARRDENDTEARQSGLLAA